MLGISSIEIDNILVEIPSGYLEKGSSVDV